MNDELERLIDAHGLVAVLEAIGKVCEEKAHHIASSYDDMKLAGAWHRAGRHASVAGACVFRTWRHIYGS